MNLNRRHSEKPKILVVGAGPSGLVFALTCAEAGIDALGGQVPSRESLYEC